MRFGVCTNIGSTAAAEAAGFDFVEWPLASALRPETVESDILPALQDVLSTTRLRPEAWNLFVPGDVKIVGDSVDGERVRRYLHAALSRVATLGGKVVVFGSGGARRVPDGFSRTRAQEQIADFLREAGTIAAAHGVVVAIEPLNAGECNILNSVAEGVQMAETVRMPAVRVLSDLYHVGKDRQSFDETRDAGNLLAHVHVATVPQRRAPMPADTDELIPFFRILKQMNYANRVSVEGNWADFNTQAAECVQTLHRAWDAA